MAAGAGVVECLTGLHPAVRIAARQIDLEREAACDDRVVLRTGAVKRYASCLAEAAALASTARARTEPALLPGAVRGSSALRTRVGRLLDGTRRRASSLAPSITAASVLTVSAAVLTASQLDPLVAFDATRALRHVAAISSLVTGAPTVQGIAVDDVVGAHDRCPRRWRAAARVRSGSAGARTRRASAPSSEDAQPPAPQVEAGASVLSSRAFFPASAAPVVPEPSSVTASTPPASPWSAAAEGGAAVGSAVGKSGMAIGAGAKKAGTSVAGFFTRAGRAVGKSF